MIRVAILAALPQEYRPFKIITGSWRSLTRRPFKVFLHRTARCELFLVETGMGGEQAEEATRHLLTVTPLDLIVSTGFAGSLNLDLPVGQVVCARDLAVWDPTATIPRVERFRLGAPPLLNAFCETQGIQTTGVVTLDRPYPKTVLARYVGSTPTVVDMESAEIAEMAYRRGIAFLCLRAVSDALKDRIEWDLENIIDKRGRVHIAKVLTMLLKKPTVLASFHRLWRNSRHAGRRLAQSLSALLQWPEEDLRELIRELQLLPVAPRGPRPPANGADPTDDAGSRAHQCDRSCKG
jgi:adenosylhomocysteine nucleosidase